MAVYITGDTHGERGRFLYTDTPFEQKASEGDTLIICGDFGYIFDNSPAEREFLDVFVKKPYVTCFVDGNHENFDVLNSYPVEQCFGGDVHVIKRDEAGKPKLVHLMRGQVFEIEGKKIFAFGGAYSIDKPCRAVGRSWWPEEMPNDSEYKIAIDNLKKYDFKVDYIITHTAPLNKMFLLTKEITEERTVLLFQVRDLATNEEIV
jgi:predicted phosphodiesterase